MTLSRETGSSAPTGTVAIVDGDGAIRDSLCLLLDTQGWQPIPFALGEHFLEYLTDKSPDCMILDPDLSDITGLDIMAFLARRHFEFPVVGFTAQPASRMAIDFRMTNIAALLIKPVRADVLISEVTRALLGRHKTQAGDSAIGC